MAGSGLVKQGGRFLLTFLAQEIGGGLALFVTDGGVDTVLKQQLDDATAEFAAKDAVIADLKQV